MDKNRNIAGIVIGVILIAAGVLSLLGNIFTFINWDNTWPLVVIGVGAALFVIMLLGGKTRGGLAVPGSILVTIGLIMLVMNFTNRWEAWSYAWALIIFAVGLGNLINGLWSELPDLRKKGLSTMLDGLSLFLLFGTIMEFIFSLSGESRWGSALLWGSLLALLGVYLLVTGALQMRKVDRGKVDLFWPVLMIGAGLVAVMGYLNWLPEENLLILVNLWPVLLIVAGLGIIFRDRSAWVGAGLGVFLVAAVFVVSLAGGNLGLSSLQFVPFNFGSIQIGDISGEQITGSGNVVSENRPVSGFDRVQFSIPGSLEIQQGPTEKLTITGEDNILPLLTTNVSGGRLAIGFKSGYNIRTIRQVQLTLTVKNLSELQNSSSGNITVKPFTTGDFHLLLSSSGSMNINGIQAKKITTELTSSGGILIAGNADQLDLRVSSSGSFQARDLRVQEASVRLSSSGNVTVWAIDTLKVNISSSGDVAYYGSPALNTSLTSSGRLIAKGEK